ncbi:MAG: CBS domain-containing protein [Methanomassiliicoccales archaeon]
MRSTRDLDEPVRNMVTKKLIGVEAGTSIQEGAGRMVEFGIGSLVVTEGGKVVGLITDSDIRRLIASGMSVDTRAEEVMTEDPVTADINTPVKDALEIMYRRRIKHLLITEEGEIEGIVTLRDLEDLDRLRLETYISRE